MENKEWINARIKAYYDWLRDNTLITMDEATGWYGAATPFVGLMNDHIEIFVKKEGGRILLSDDGETINNLSMMGINVMKSSSRKSILEKIKLNYDVDVKNGELMTVADDSSFPERKHALLSAIQAVSDLKYTANTNIVSMFSEEVGNYMDSLDMIYTPHFNIQGKTGMNFVFDFQIAGRKSELVIKAYNRLSQSDVERFLFSIHDISRTREGLSNKKFNSMVIVNDVENTPNNMLMNVLREEDTKVLRWSERTPAWKTKDFKIA